MFSQASASHSVHWGEGGRLSMAKGEGRVWQKGACMAEGVCMVGGMCGRGPCGGGVVHAGETATETGVTHPTGMYSSDIYFL